MANGGGTDGRKDRRLEIPPCVLQDIGPLGPLPKKVKMNQIKASSLKSRPLFGQLWAGSPVKKINEPIPKRCTHSNCFYIGDLKRL